MIWMCEQESSFVWSGKNKHVNRSMIYVLIIVSYNESILFEIFKCSIKFI